VWEVGKTAFEKQVTAYCGVPTGCGLVSSNHRLCYPNPPPWPSPRGARLATGCDARALVVCGRKPRARNYKPQATGYEPALLLGPSLRRGDGKMLGGSVNDVIGLCT